MKKRIWYYFLILLVVTSCIDKTVVENPVLINELVVSPGFDWETTRVVEFAITASSATMIRIKSDDGNLLYHQGFYSELPAPYNVRITLPKSVKNVLVNDVLIPIISEKLVVNLDRQALPSRIRSVLAALPDPLAYWKLDETQGTAVGDETGVYEGFATGHNWVLGINGNALSLDGSTGQVRIDPTGALNPVNDQISFSLWFKLDEVGSSGAFLFHNTKYILKIDAQGRLTFALYIPGYKDVVMTYADRILDTDWHQMTATYDGAVMKLYLDARLMASEAVSGNIKSSNASLLIGSQTANNYFKGQLDDIRILGYALTEEQVNALYVSSQQPGTGNEDLLSFWDLNENQGSRVMDNIGTNHGTLTDATWAKGMSGSCLNFNGTTAVVTVPSSPSLNITETLTMMAWVKTSANATAKIFQKGDWDGFGIGQDKWKGWTAHIRTDDNVTHSIYWKGGLPVFNQWYHVAMSYDGAALRLYVNGQLQESTPVSGKLKLTERPVSIGSDNGVQKFYAGSIDEVKLFGKALNQLEIQTNFKAATQPVDSDGDGIADADDNFPDDPARTFINYFPVEGFGSLAFEDLWPGKGDYDFNDLVLDYRMKIVTNAQNKVTEVLADFAIKAIGAGLDNGFGFQFDNSALVAADVQVEGAVINENYIQLAANGIEENQDIPTYIVFDNANKIMQSTSGFGVNVYPEKPYVEPDTIRINIGVKPGVYSINELNVSGFNPFLIVNKERGKEVHLPDRKPTKLADVSLFGQLEDDSKPESGRYYKTRNNLPWALNISSYFDHAIESVEITAAHLKFAAWAQSSGVKYSDWFKDLPGYRDAEKIFKPKK